MKIADLEQIIIDLQADNKMLRVCVQQLVTGVCLFAGRASADEGLRAFSDQCHNVLDANMPPADAGRIAFEVHEASAARLTIYC
jgi:hypothetical protein